MEKNSNFKLGPASRSRIMDTNRYKSYCATLFLLSRNSPKIEPRKTIWLTYLVLGRKKWLTEGDVGQNLESSGLKTPQKSCTLVCKAQWFQWSNSVQQIRFISFRFSNRLLVQIGANVLAYVSERSFTIPGYEMITQMTLRYVGFGYMLSQNCRHVLRADQLTLSRPGGHIIPTQYCTPPQIFRPWDMPAHQCPSHHSILLT